MSLFSLCRSQNRKESVFTMRMFPTYPGSRALVVSLGLMLLMTFRPQGMLGKREEMVVGEQ